MLEKTVNEMLTKTFPDERVSATVDERRIVHLQGECSSWQTLIDVGHAVAHVEGVRNVVSDMTAKGVEIKKKDYTTIVETGMSKSVIEDVDVLIVGAGIIGCGIARELSKFNLNVLVAESGDDVSTGCSKANNGCIHHGMAVKPGTLKSEMNRLGNLRYDDWERELHIGMVKPGYLEVVTKAEDLPKVYARFELGLMNKVPGMKILTPEQVNALEPALEENGIHPVAALYLPNFGMVETPYVCVALAENATVNGVRFLFNTTVGQVLTENNKIVGAVTNKGIIRCRYLVNAAGMYADDIAEMAGDRLFTIHNRRGTIAIFDKATPPTFQVPTVIWSGLVKKGKNVESKGGGMHPTPENNLLIGPSAEEVPDKEDTETYQVGLDYCMEGCFQDPLLHKGDIIKIFAGARPADFMEDFTIEMSDVTHGLVHACCTQSPGVASSPAVADRVVGIIVDDLTSKGEDVHVKPDYNPIREKPVEFRHMTRDEQDKLIEKDPRYGRIICRCEQVTEGEILDVLHSPVVPHSITAIKNRTRAGMGRCQGGFCQPRVLEIIARELGQEWIDVNLNGEGSNILVKSNRGEEAQG